LDVSNDGVPYSVVCDEEKLAQIIVLLVNLLARKIPSLEQIKL